MKLYSIASGSSGNCIYVGSETTHLLIDAGVSGKCIEAGLNGIGLKTAEMAGILVTHEHVDHIKALGVLARRYGLPMYATPGTVDFICSRQAIGKVDESLFRKIQPNVPFALGDLTITPLATSHDAAEPVSYVLRRGEKSAAVLTDLGMWDDNLVAKLQGLDVLLLEANHDVRMLQVGAYPYYLKQRILGEKGHLSNESAGQLLGRLLHDGFQKVLLGHLSKENNYPQLAYESVKMEITMGDNPYKGTDFPMEVARRDAPSALITI